MYTRLLKNKRFKYHLVFKFKDNILFRCTFKFKYLNLNKNKWGLLRGLLRDMFKGDIKNSLGKTLL